MLAFFRRILRVFKAEGNSMLDRIEDPIKLTEQGIDNLKKDLTESLKGLAEAKALAVRTRREVESQRRAVGKYEEQAVLLLQKAQRGEITQEKADHLASHALQQKGHVEKNLKTAEVNMKTYQGLVSKMESQTTELRNKITHYENELRTLRARSRVSSATKRINQQLSKVDSRSTVALLEKMKAKVQEQEALAESYSEVAGLATSSVDDEVERILGGSTDTTKELEALKSKLQLSQNASQSTNEAPKQSINPEQMSELEKLKAKLKDKS